MAKYLVQAETTTHYSTVIEADNEKDAWEKARSVDGADFNCNDEEDWHIYNVEETDEEEEDA